MRHIGKTFTIHFTAESLNYQKKQSVKHQILTFFTFFIFAVLIIGNHAQAEPIVYPAKGQSTDQENKDKGECYQWAVQNTGVDPQALARETGTGEIHRNHHQILGGAARGTLLGVVGGAIAGDAGKGAAIGAGVGALAGGMRSRRDLEMTQEVNASVVAHQQAAMDKFDRAYGACLEGRGYTIK